MGLGKTVQAIGAAELLRKKGLVANVLIICPTSLKYQWKKEIEKFTGSDVRVIEGHHLKRRQQYEEPEFYKIVSYNAVSNDIKILKKFDGFDLVIYDEVQRLKNWNTQISKSARKIKSDYTIALSGTPLENKLEELYSVMQLVDQYRLGPLYRFMDNSIITNENGKIIGYRNLNQISKQIAPVVARRTKAQVALQLPSRIDKVLFVPMTSEQWDIHEDFKAAVARIIHKWKTYHFLSETDRKRLLLLLSQMRMVCDSTFILDQKTRNDTKVEEIVNIIKDTIESGNEKIVIFSQWERMTRIIAQELEKQGIGFENLNGGVPSEKRRKLTENFTENPLSRVFLSTDAGSTGLNLQVASIIINVDLPWNPAILEQRIARIYRIGQTRNIQVINLVAMNTIEERMLSTLDFKSNLFKGILSDGEDTVMLDDSKLEKIMEKIQGFATDTDDPEGVEPEGVENDTEPPVEADDNENSHLSDIQAEQEENSENIQDPNQETQNTGADDPEAGRRSVDRGTNITNVVSDSSNKMPAPGNVIEQGVSFLSGLAKTLQSPEATRKLVDNIVKTDPTTGQTSINIPVSDKKAVENIFNLIGKLFK